MDYTVSRPTVANSDNTPTLALRVTDLPFLALGGQPSFTPDDLVRFLSANRIAVVSYLRLDGRPNQTPLWYHYDDGRITFSIDTTSAKRKALARDPRVCVTIQDERPPYRAVIIEGTVELGDRSNHDLNGSLAQRYFGRLGAKEYLKLYNDVREHAGATIVHLHPTEVKGFDNTHAINSATLGFFRLRYRLPIPMRWL